MRITKKAGETRHGYPKQIYKVYCDDNECGVFEFYGSDGNLIQTTVIGSEKQLDQYRMDCERFEIKGV